MPKSTKTPQHKRKVREYARVLRKDEDWDWAFIIRLLQYKLKRTRFCIESNNIAASSKRIAKEIKAVENLFGAVLENRYYDEFGKNFTKKYGSGRFVYGKKERGTKYRSVSVCFRGETEKNRKKILREFCLLHRRADHALERDLNKAFALMAKNIMRWWD